MKTSSPDPTKFSITPIALITLAMALVLTGTNAMAYPPAPYYRIYGTVRDDRGNPLSSSAGSVVLIGVHSALGTATVSSGVITGVTITNGGSGFTSLPEVDFTGGGGKGASGTPILTDGVVTGVTLTSGGIGYTGPVTVGFTGGGAPQLEIVRSITNDAIAPGINYSLSVPMDSGTNAQLYEVTAMRPLLPFTIRIVINGVNHVPIQIAAATSPFWTEIINSVNSPGVATSGSHWAIGLPADKLRMDLWLGIDSNNDGLPDAWQWEVVNSDPTGRLTDFTEVDPNADFSGNGMTNWESFLTGVYALEALDGLHFQINSVTDDIAELQFQAIAGRTYHISSSTDLETWTDPQPFFLNSDASDVNGARSHYSAENTAVVKIYVQGEGVAEKQFRIHAQ